MDTSDPRLSGASQNDFLIGKIAMDVLVGMIQRGERGLPKVPVRTLVDGTWIPGKRWSRDHRECAVRSSAVR